jgi:hypothetical protein
MTPPTGTAPTQAHTSRPLNSTDDAGHRTSTEHFTDLSWESDSPTGGAGWSPASYWVRRKRAEAVGELGR